MLDIYLFEPDTAHRKIMKDICTAYAIKRNIDHNFKSRDEIPKSISCTEGYSVEAALYIIKSSERIKTLAVSISKINYDNYTVLIADSLDDILAYISAEFRPAGVLIKPAEYPAAEKIFDDIYEDHKKRSSVSSSQFRFKIRSREYSIGTEAILYFEASNKKTVLRTTGQAFEFYMSFDEVLKKLPDCFVQIHKSYIVNTKHIAVSDYKNMSVELDDGSVIYISRTYKKNLQDKTMNK